MKPKRVAAGLVAAVIFSTTSMVAVAGTIRPQSWCDWYPAWPGCPLSQQA